MQDPAASAKGTTLSRALWARGPKRACDLLLGSLGLMLLSPLLLTAMLLVKLSSAGPIFFRQVRTGRGGREFQPYKLRTMRGGRAPDPNELVPLDHPEITAVGRLLRRLKIDELPQVLNVVKGDMSLIGPRPTLPEQTREYDEFKKQRLLVRPGLTGLAQVNGNTAISWDERIKYDVYYVRNHGFWMDVGILLKTGYVLLRGEARFARPFDQSPYAKQEPDNTR
jgi:lipopolysaccharide/colanic/teichoic acid biosynthesis glycosyltransferase